MEQLIVIKENTKMIKRFEEIKRVSLATEYYQIRFEEDQTQMIHNLNAEETFSSSDKDSVELFEDFLRNIWFVSYI